MARIRTIKPEFWSSEQIVELSTTARLLFIGLWNFCDDAGNHPASPRTLKMQVFPGDDFTTEQITAYISEMILARLIIEYEADSKKYWHVTGWHHQKIEKPNYRYPAATNQQFADHSATDRRPFDPVRESNSKGKEKEGSGSVNAHAHAQEENSEKQKNDDTPLPDQICATIAQWVETDRGIELLKTWKRDTGYSDRIHGPTTAELRKYVAHHLKSPQRDRIITNPVTHFTEQFPGWLANATQFNRKRTDTPNPTPPRYTPPRTNSNATGIAAISDITGKIVQNYENHI